MKPGFFRNEELAELPCEARLLFAGLWCMADREGRLEDRPKRIKIELFPADTFDVEPLLSALAAKGLIERYAVDGEAYIQVVNFARHQSPHFKEAPSMIPESGAGLRQASDKPGASPSAAALIPDSGFLIPESNDSDAMPEALDRDAWNRWLQYRREIRKPLKPASIPAAQRKLAAFGSDQSAVVEQSLAQGWTGLFPLKDGPKKTNADGTVRVVV